MFSHLGIPGKLRCKSRTCVITASSSLKWVPKAEKWLCDHIECKASCTDMIMMFLFVLFTIRSKTNLIFINGTVIMLSKGRMKMSHMLFTDVSLLPCLGII